MYYALVYYLDSPPDYIQEIRKDLDSRFNTVRPHLTLVFPIRRLGKDVLERHITSVLKKSEPIKISWGNINIASDYNIFLPVNQGREEIVHLHKELYSGVLAPFLRQDIPYIPHVTLGNAHPDVFQSYLMDFAPKNESKKIVVIDNLSFVAFESLDAPDAWEKTLFFGS